MKAKSEKSFIDRVLDRLKGGDESKIARFQAKAIKFYTNQIGIRKSEIDTLEEKIDDLNEKYEDTLLVVDFDRIKTTDDVESYIPEYTRKAIAVKKDIKKTLETIEAKKVEIADFETLIADLKS